MLADPYFKDVPSLQAEEKKTALLFHAKDDLPEVRREVFSLIQRHAIRFSAIVRDKLRVLGGTSGGAMKPRRITDTARTNWYPFHGAKALKQRLHKHGAYPCSLCARRQALYASRR